MIRTKRDQYRVLKAALLRAAEFVDQDTSDVILTKQLAYCAALLVHVTPQGNFYDEFTAAVERMTAQDNGLCPVCRAEPADKETLMCKGCARQADIDLYMSRDLSHKRTH